MDANDIRVMERTRGRACANTVWLLIVVPVLAVLTWVEHGLWLYLLAACLGLAAESFAWWLFRAGCRDYDRRRASRRDGRDAR